MRFHEANRRIGVADERGVITAASWAVFAEMQLQMLMEGR